eukprot:TRINITY_DN33237_c0_g1_i1.p1 TRINITY_DN33237_c0_g1~~TRINITY_DN33237_c0_g1_i1.p1  ORF type:complete len:421 (+),score=32.00 TRINITY_DN33237_c0_g1_i1:94-1356(+)
MEVGAVLALPHNFSSSEQPPYENDSSASDDAQSLVEVLGNYGSPKSPLEDHVCSLYGYEGTLPSLNGMSLKSIGRRRQYASVSHIRIDGRTQNADSVVREVAWLFDTLQVGHCPYLVNLLDVFTSSHCVVEVATDLMDAGNLASVMDIASVQGHSVMPHSLSLCWTRKALRGLKHLHEHEHAHQRIYPSNILFDFTGEVKLTDFWTPQSHLEGLNDVHMEMRNARYMCPQRLFGDDYGCLTDIWSLGMILFGCVTNQRPFSDCRNFRQLVSVITRSPEPRLPEGQPYPDGLRNVIAKCLQRSVGERFSASALLDAPYFEEAAQSSELSSWLLALAGGRVVVTLSPESQDGVPSGVVGTSLAGEPVVRIAVGDLEHITISELRQQLATSHKLTGCHCITFIGPEGQCYENCSPDTKLKDLW